MNVVKVDGFVGLEMHLPTPGLLCRQKEDGFTSLISVFVV